MVCNRIARKIIDAETNRTVPERPTTPATRNPWIGLNKLMGRMLYFFFFILTIKIAGSALLDRVGRVSGNTAIVYAKCAQQFLSS